MAATIYALCALTSLGCVLLLGRAYARGRVPLLLWCSAASALLALNNVLLVVDLVLVPQVSFQLLRTATAAAAVVVLLVGLVWHGR